LMMSMMNPSGRIDSAVGLGWVMEREASFSG
jgi:hypothetical protein